MSKNVAAPTSSPLQSTSFFFILIDVFGIVYFNIELPTIALSNTKAMPPPAKPQAQGDDLQLDVDKAFRNRVLLKSSRKTTVSKPQSFTRRQRVQSKAFERVPHFSPRASSSADRLRESDSANDEAIGPIEPIDGDDPAQRVLDGLLSCPFYKRNRGCFDVRDHAACTEPFYNINLVKSVDRISAASRQLSEESFTDNTICL